MKYIIIITSLLISGITFTQFPLYKNEKQWNIGLGFNPTSIPIKLGFDQAISNTITIGGAASFSSFKVSGDHFATLGLSCNANYHLGPSLNLSKTIDFYGGGSMDLYKTFGTKSGLNGLGISLQLGGRYALNKKTSINLELAAGTYLGGHIGATFRL